MMRQWKLILFAGLMLWLVGCGKAVSTSATTQTASLPTALHITSYTLNGEPAIDRTSQNTKMVQQLYQMAYTLPLAHSGVIFAH